MLHIPPTKVLLTAQKNKSHAKQPTCKKKWRFREKEVKRMGPKHKTERTTGLGKKNKRGDIEKWDRKTDSPEIPDKGGETSELPGLPSGRGREERETTTGTVELTSLLVQHDGQHRDSAATVRVGHQRPHLDGHWQARHRVCVDAANGQHRACLGVKGHGQDGHVEAALGVGHGRPVAKVALVVERLQLGLHGSAGVGVVRVGHKRDERLLRSGRFTCDRVD